MTHIRIDDLDPMEALSPEEMDAVLGAGRSSFRPRLEALEDRLLLSGAPNIPPPSSSGSGAPLAALLGGQIATGAVVTLSTAPLPAQTAGQYFSLPISASGGSGRYIFSLDPA